MSENDPKWKADYDQGRLVMPHEGAASYADKRAALRNAPEVEQARSEAARALFDAAGRVPICKRGDAEPYSTCLGCGMTDGTPCAAGCWVFGLDIARGRVAEAFAWSASPSGGSADGR